MEMKALLPHPRKSGIIPDLLLHHKQRMDSRVLLTEAGPGLQTRSQQMASLINGQVSFHTNLAAGISVSATLKHIPGADTRGRW